jgi:hypothetical protein
MRINSKDCKIFRGHRCFLPAARLISEFAFNSFPRVERANANEGRIWGSASSLSM